MEYISDRLTKPKDIEEVFEWNKLSTKAQNTLQRAIERSDVWRTSKLSGFSFLLLSKITLKNLYDARFIGPARAEGLIQELVLLFDGLNSEKDLNVAGNVASQLIISISSLHVLAKLTVEEDLEKYLERIGSVDLLTPEQQHKLLQDLLPSKNPFKRVMFGKRNQDIALGHLIDANLQLSFALAKRVCVDRNLRARTISGNLGLLAGITLFSDQPNIDFESYIMRYIRKFIQDLVGSLNLSYDDIVELMLDANKSESDYLEVEKAPEETASFHSCATFSELYKELDRELLKLPKVNQRAIEMVKHRHHAFAEPRLSLDEIGEKWGVSRERVRQITDPLMKIELQTESEVPILLRAVEIFEQCEDEEQFKALATSDLMFEDVEMTWERLWGLTLIFSTDTLANRVYEKHKEWEDDFGSNSTIRTSIRTLRSRFGLYDLQVVSKKYEIDKARAFNVISNVYPRSIRCGDLVLARLKTVDTMFENSIAKQLKVTSPLGVHELLKGLQRSGKARKVPLIGSTTDLSNLIQELAGNTPNYSKASSGLIKVVEFGLYEEWLIEIFLEANLGILHSNDVVNFALRDRRINVSSAFIYLLNSPIMRAHGRGLYSLVGTEVSEDQLDAYIEIIRGTSEVSEVSYEMLDASKGILSVKPNLNVIANGIVFPPSGYKEIFKGFAFASSCACGELETIQTVKYAPSGFWTGFTAMIRHGFLNHQMSKGSTLHFEFDFDNFVVKLLVN